MIYIMYYILYYMYNDCFTFCISMYHMHSWCLHMSEEKVGSLGTRIMGGCEPQCECWKVNLVSLQEQQTLLISDLSLQSSCYLLKSLFLLIWSTKHRSLGLIYTVGKYLIGVSKGKKQSNYKNSCQEKDKTTLFLASM